MPQYSHGVEDSVAGDLWPIGDVMTESKGVAFFLKTTTFAYRNKEECWVPTQTSTSPKLEHSFSRLLENCNFSWGPFFNLSITMPIGYYRQIVGNSADKRLNQAIFWQPDKTV